MSWLLSCVLLIVSLPVECFVSKGYSYVRQGTVDFLTKFCFSYDKKEVAGIFEVNLHMPQRVQHKGTAFVMLLDDQAESYPDDDIGVWNSYSCDEMKNHSRWWQNIDMARVAEPKGQSFSIHFHERIRPRWWFVAIASCSAASFPLEYTVHAKNPLLGWQAELSFDTAGMVHICIVLLLINVALALAQFYAKCDLARDTLWSTHPLVRVITAGLACSAGSQIFLFMHYRCITIGGEGWSSIYVAGKFLQASSKCCVMTVLLLVSLGLCVSRPLGSRDLPRLLGILGPLCLAGFLLELWGETASSRTYTTDFVYATNWGHLLIFVDLALLGVYQSNLWQSYQREEDPEKKAFYSTWGQLFSAWFFGLPAVAIVGHFLAPWVQFRVLYVVSSSIHAAFLCVLVVGLWPTQRRPLFTLEPIEMVSIQSEGFLAGVDKSWQPLDSGLEY